MKPWLPALLAAAGVLVSGSARASWGPLLIGDGDHPQADELRMTGELALQGGAISIAWSRDTLTQPFLFLGASGFSPRILAGGGVQRSLLRTAGAELRLAVGLDLQATLDGGFGARVAAGCSWRFDLDSSRRIRLSGGVDGRLGGGLGSVRALVVDLGVPVGLEGRIGRWGAVALRFRPAVEHATTDAPVSGRLDVSLLLHGFIPRTR
jgi:hypothetical protein